MDRNGNSRSPLKYTEVTAELYLDLDEGRSCTRCPAHHWLRSSTLSPSSSTSFLQKNSYNIDEAITEVDLLRSQWLRHRVQLQRIYSFMIILIKRESDNIVRKAIYAEKGNIWRDESTTRMRRCSRGGWDPHWTVALSASNDSSFATLNALNTSYNIQYLMLHAIPDAICNTWCKVESNFQWHLDNIQYQMLHDINDVTCNT